jgi:glutamine amidotransferase
MIAIIDYGMGNPAAIGNMLNRLGVQSKLLRDPKDTPNLQGMILPGVGAFDEGISRLSDTGWKEFIYQKHQDGDLPLLGICLGMQMLFHKSEEGTRRGLGLIPGKVTLLADPDGTKPRLRVPHMGWSSLNRANENAIVANLPADARFYFAHSYHCVCENMEDIVGTSEYGFSFISVVARNSLYGVQFHPEKSHKYGMLILKNFAAIVSR